MSEVRNMLRIGFEKNSGLIRIHLEGKLSGPWVDELERAWYEMTQEDHPRPKHIVIDLSGVSFVDSEGKKLLTWMFQQGAELRDGNLLTKFIIEEITAGRTGRW